jgi:hypothetical protein
MGGSSDAPEKTAEQVAMEKRQRSALQEEAAASERRLKAIAQKKIGKASLLGMPIQQAEAPAGPTTTPGYMQTSGGQVKSLVTKASGKSVGRKAAKKSIIGGLF